MSQQMGAQQALDMSKRPQQTAMPQGMGTAQQATSMSQGPQQKIDYAAQNAAGLGKLGNYGPPPSLPAQMGPQQAAQQTAMPQGMGPMGPQQAAQQTAMPLGDGFKGAGAGAGFGAPPTGPQFNPASLQGKPMKKGGAVKKMASGGTTSSASKRADGIAQRGKTRGKMC
jgi:hypothetical protein